MWLITVFLLYLILLATVGAYCVRFNRNLADFVLGGRRLGPWVTALSAQASDMSAWLLIALPAFAYSEGLSALWIVIGLAVGTVFNWLIIAPRLRRETGLTGALTIPDYLASRFGQGRLPFVRIISVIVILLAYTTYIASQFMAAGKTFHTTFSEVETPCGILSVSYHTGIFVGIGIILLYTALGGFTAVAWTDFAQGLLMVLTLVVLPIVALAGLGGLPLLWQKLHSINPNLLGLSGAKGASGLAFWMGVCIAGMSWGLGYPGQPHILVRFMALRDPKQMRRASLIGIVWVLLAMTGAVFVGFTARVILGPLADAEHAMPALATRLMHPALAGVMIAGAVAAMMSTVDSQLLVAASAVEEDIYIRLLGGHPRGKAAVWIGRITVLALGALAIMLAWDSQSVFQKVFNAWGVLAAGLGPAIILGLLTKRTNAFGATVGIAVGLVVAQFWSFVNPVFGGDLLFDSGLIPGFVLNLLLAYLLSLLANRFASNKKPAQ